MSHLLLDANGNTVVCRRLNWRNCPEHKHLKKVHANRAGRMRRDKVLLELVANDYVDTLLDNLNRFTNVEGWREDIEGAQNVTPVSLKTFVSDPANSQLYTLQATFNKEGELTKVWQPGRRGVTVAATFMELDGSRRDFAGVVHVAHSDDCWVGFDKDMNTVLVYRKTFI